MCSLRQHIHYKYTYEVSYQEEAGARHSPVSMDPSTQETEVGGRPEPEARLSSTLCDSPPQLLGMLMDPNHPVVIRFPFAVLSYVTDGSPRVPKPSVKHSNTAFGIHVTGGT